MPFTCSSSGLGMIVQTPSPLGGGIRGFMAQGLKDDDNNDQYEDNKNKILRSIEKELRTEREEKAKFEKKANLNDLETRDFLKTKLYLLILEKLNEYQIKISGGTKKKYISKINNKKNQTRKKRY